MFITALFIIARTWKQPRCPSSDEWKRKLWYIYTMEYYSAIKKDTFESVLMMKLEPIIQSEVVWFSSVAQSCPTLCDTMNCMQHARPPCPSPTPGVHSNLCPSIWKCHPAITYSVIPFSCPQSLPASESFLMSQLFA